MMAPCRATAMAYAAVIARRFRCRYAFAAASAPCLRVTRAAERVDGCYELRTR